MIINYNNEIIISTKNNNYIIFTYNAKFNNAIIQTQTLMNIILHVLSIF